MVLVVNENVYKNEPSVYVEQVNSIRINEEVSNHVGIDKNNRNNLYYHEKDEDNEVILLEENLV